jgi:ectoine hydroxylase-related dioxygenase (phytanoyl-CoA dioxygenase family)
MNSFPENGYAIAPNILQQEEIELIKIKIARAIKSDSDYGIRNIAKKVPAIETLAHSAKIINSVTTYLGSSPKLVRAIYFNKTQNNNWFVGWHQDKTIAVVQKIDTPGFINWTTKQGVIHVQPPESIMQQIITVRLHLDKTGIDKGALQLIPKSHRQGILSQIQIDRLKDSSNSIICELNAGDALIMSPLILHSSSKSRSTKERAIIHLEYSAIDLPNNLTWA